MPNVANAVKVLVLKNASEPAPAEVNVPAANVPVNVPAEQLVTVNVPILTPTAPDTPNVPVVLMVTLGVPLAPARLTTDMAPLEPVPRVKVMAGSIVTIPKVIRPDPPSRVELAFTEVALVVPKFIC